MKVYKSVIDLFQTRVPTTNIPFIAVFQCNIPFEIFTSCRFHFYFGTEIANNQQMKICFFFLYP